MTASIAPIPAAFFPQLPDPERQRLARHARQRQTRIDKVQRARERAVRRARRVSAWLVGGGPEKALAIIQSAPLLPASYGLDVRPCGDCGLPFNDEYHPPPQRLCKKVRVI